MKFNHRHVQNMFFYTLKCTECPVFWKFVKVVAHIYVRAVNNQSRSYDFTATCPVQDFPFPRKMYI